MQFIENKTCVYVYVYVCLYIQLSFATISKWFATMIILLKYWLPDTNHTTFPAIPCHLYSTLHTSKPGFWHLRTYTQTRTHTCKNPPTLTRMHTRTLMVHTHVCSVTPSPPNPNPIPPPTLTHRHTL